MTKEELHKQIDRYFDGELSATEEKDLLETLLRHRDDADDAVDGALAVMSWSRISPGKSQGETVPPHRMRRRRRTAISISAGIAAAATVLACVALSQYLGSTTPQCYAYVNGRYISDPAEVDAMIGLQISEMGEVSRQTSTEALAEFDDIADAISSEIDNLK